MFVKCMNPRCEDAATEGLWCNLHFRRRLAGPTEGRDTAIAYSKERRLRSREERRRLRAGLGPLAVATPASKSV